jgi:hypothetical protein
MWILVCASPTCPSSIGQPDVEDLSRQYSSQKELGSTLTTTSSAFFFFKEVKSGASLATT